jgi:hypothetical protein
VNLFTDATASAEDRLQAAADLSLAIPEFGKQPPNAEQPKLYFLLGLIRQCRPVFDRDPDSRVQPAAAQVLGHLYRQTHSIFKPDDNAKDRAVRIYREKHRAAAAASQAIVIYPTK